MLPGLLSAFVSAGQAARTGEFAPITIFEAVEGPQFGR
jgi:hypothetical protein